MDAVMDLTARAVTFIGLIQQQCVHYAADVNDSHRIYHLLEPSDTLHPLLRKQSEKNLDFKKRAVELVWINNRKAEEKEVSDLFLRRSESLFEWMWREDNLKLLREDVDLEDKLPSPGKWRNIISRILYRYPKKRTELAIRLQYLPVQIVLACGGGSYNTKTQRLLQEWQVSPEDLKIIIADEDLNFLEKYKKFTPADAGKLLESEEELVAALIHHKAPLPFDLILSQELKEIEVNRQRRRQEQDMANRDDSEERKSTLQPAFDNQDKPVGDAVSKAKNMHLYALAFSGGGIRSATFNLGVLQGFAKAGLLSKFDYLSTVSGGGYIGSWLAAWIKREGSLIRVSDRLNPERSSDPLAEEVRPIRWLRMYSNYLTPSTGIMSLDSWTVGMTVIRNMLLNQMIILLLLLTLLLCGRFLFLVWSRFTDSINPGMSVSIFIICSILLLAASLTAGLGMRFYNKKRVSSNISIRKEKTYVNKLLLVLGFMAAFIVSAWLYSNYDITSGSPSKGFIEILTELKFPIMVSFAGLMIVAVLGRYDDCIPHKGRKKIGGYLIIVAGTAISAIAGAILLTLGWELIGMMKETGFTEQRNPFPNYNHALAFTLGIPLLLEVISITVVIRMALLGSYFPDERREWWGRMGGSVHLFAFLWILVAGAALLGNYLIGRYVPQSFSDDIITAAGGWAALVISAVTAAFSSKSSKKEEPGFLSAALNILARIGPYLFGLGLLIFLPTLLNNVLFKLYPRDQNTVWLIFKLILVLGAATILFTWRIGVNEFSMHHFYRNRLVRAYLGATRRRPDRKNSSNPYTGFDSHDDVLLSDLVHEKGYYGPYPIINTTLNASQVSELDRQDRKAESFIFSPLYCGFDFSRTRASVNVNEKSYDYGFRPTGNYAYPKGPHIGSAMAISGAAANPNQGFHSSPATAFLLTAFNVRLGWWIGNPRKNAWKSSDPGIGLAYLIANLVGKSDTNDRFICLSDGGHFDNMGLYELIRRRASVIVLGDAEQDDKFTCEGLANAIRRCRIDFGAEIDIDVSAITGREGNLSSESFAIGTISYPGESNGTGILIYLKSSITKDASVDVREYSLKNPGFPHQSTGDQFFDETQFESYRKLGLGVAEAALADEKIKRVLVNGPEAGAGMFSGGIQDKYQKLLSFIKTNISPLIKLVKED